MDKQAVYFISRSENVAQVLLEAIQRTQTQRVTIFFDLDGTRALDERYAEQISQDQKANISELIEYSIKIGIKMYVCQMNVMNSCHLHCTHEIESAGVVTFLEYGYQADAIFSY